jgi:hypothetical protein
MGSVRLTRGHARPSHRWSGISRSGGRSRGRRRTTAAGCTRVSRQPKSVAGASRAPTADGGVTRTRRGSHPRRRGQGNCRPGSRQARSVQRPPCPGQHRRLQHLPAWHRQASRRPRREPLPPHLERHRRRGLHCRLGLRSRRRGVRPVRGLRVWRLLRRERRRHHHGPRLSIPALRVWLPRPRGPGHRPRRRPRASTGIGSRRQAQQLGPNWRRRRLGVAMASRAAPTSPAAPRSGLRQPRR